MERYRTIYNSYYHSAHGVMCVYDLTDERSFENLKNYWVKVRLKSNIYVRNEKRRKGIAKITINSLISNR